jgi:hypothetical protein
VFFTFIIGKLSISPLKEQFPDILVTKIDRGIRRFDRHAEGDREDVLLEMLSVVQLPSEESALQLDHLRAWTTPNSLVQQSRGNEFVNPTKTFSWHRTLFFF